MTAHREEFEELFRLEFDRCVAAARRVLADGAAAEVGIVEVGFGRLIAMVPTSSAAVASNIATASATTVRGPRLPGGGGGGDGWGYPPDGIWGPGGGAGTPGGVT